MFTNTYLPHVGGVARSVKMFSEDLRKMGHAVLVVAPTFEGSEHLVEKADEVLRVPAIQNFNGSDFSLRIPVPFFVNEKINEFQPDIVHSHHPYLLGDSALRAAKQRGLPVVFTHHTRYEEYTHYVSSNSETLRRFAIHLSTEYANLCDRVVAPSKSIARLIKDRGVSRPISVIPTGVDNSFFSQGEGETFRKRHRLDKKAFVVGHVGRLAPEKNLLFLAEAVADFVKNDPAAVFLVVGEGPSREKIEDIFRNSDIKERLVATGQLTGKTLADAYQAMDVFVFASQSETQGMVVAEAMSAGKPVIALDAPGVREVLQDEINGRQLPKDASMQTFSAAIVDLKRHPEKHRIWQNQALQTSRQLSRATCARQLADVYGSILKIPLYKEAHENDHFKGFEELLERIKVEWELTTQKVSALVNTFQEK
jgi:glycosyltransferase involved in cell wall biosynthesis